jgi:hypothetical protein
MKRLMFTLALLCLLSSAAFAYDFQLTPIEDSFVDSFYYIHAEGAEQPYKLWAGATVNNSTKVIDGSEFTRAYLKFDLTNRNDIDKAYLWLYRVNDNWTYNDPDTGNITVYRETEEWHENTLTWQNAPNFNNNVQGNSAYINQTGWVSWNVGTFAKQAQGGTLSLVLTSPEPFHIFESKETLDGHSPFLGINVVPEPISCLLFGIGGLTLAAHRKLKRRRL